jgi:hypothetical protein
MEAPGNTAPFILEWMVSLTLTSCYHHPSWITMSTMKKKKKGANDPPVNNNRSDHKSSRTPSNIASADNKSNQKKGSKGKK